MHWHSHIVFLILITLFKFDIVLVLTPYLSCVLLPIVYIEHVAMASVKRLRSPCCHILFKGNLSVSASLLLCLLALPLSVFCCNDETIFLIARQTEDLGKNIGN